MWNSVMIGSRNTGFSLAVRNQYFRVSQEGISRDRKTWAFLKKCITMCDKQKDT